MLPAPIVAASGIGGATGIALIIGDLVITGGTSVSLGEALTVSVFAAGVVWYLGKKLQRLEDGQSEAKTHFEKLDRKLDNLPCNDRNCHAPKIRPKSPPDTDAY